LYVEKDGVTVLNQKCIRNGKIDFALSRLSDVEKKVAIDKFLIAGDILINSTGVGTAGRVGFFEGGKETTIDSHVTVVRVDINKAAPKFIFYNLLGMESEIETFAEGTTGQTELSRDRVREIAIPLPPLPEQRAIAAVLSSLDDKIDLLHRQNKTLEGMAKTVYAYFFIDNRKVSWKECPLSELANHQKISIHPNKNPASLFYHYSIPAFDEAHMPIPELGTLIQSNKYAVTKNTILFSKLNPHKDKRVWLISSSIDANSVCSTEFQVMNPKADKYLFFLYGFISHPGNYNEIAAGVGGTSGSHQRIDPDVIFTFKCFLPDDTTVTEYNETVGLIFTKIHHNRQSIQTLVKQRDSLLPKLMSGEVRVHL